VVEVAVAADAGLRVDGDVGGRRQRDPPAISHRSTPSNVTFRLLSPIGPSAPLGILIGLSMDYEVFPALGHPRGVGQHHDNERAVAHGLEHTGRIITAAAIIMIAAFSGSMLGSFVGLQEFGLGLSVAILLDATVVRAILVPA
jgi:uncharacterized membrane protein YdfJ with MMPL/SSD domain